MPPAHDPGVWKWLATTLGGMVIGGAFATSVSAFQVERLTDALNAHKQTNGHAVMQQRVQHLESDLDDLEVLLREAVAEMRRYHGSE